MRLLIIEILLKLRASRPIRPFKIPIPYLSLKLIGSLALGALSENTGLMTPTSVHGCGLF